MTAISTRRAVLAGAGIFVLLPAAASSAALAEGASAALRTAPGLDPVFEKIEAYQNARRALDKYCAEFPREDVDLDLSDDETMAVQDLLMTRPTTMRGCADQLRHLAAIAAQNDCAFLGQFCFEEGDQFLPMLADPIESWSVAAGKAVRS